MAKKDFHAMEARGASGDSAAHAALRRRVGHPTTLRLVELQPNPRNPRYPDDDPEVQELAETLRTVGQLQPAVVVPREQYLDFYPESRGQLGEQPWVVGVGNRRLAAARLAQRTTLDVRVAAEVTTVDDFEDMILIENIQRQALPPLLEAEQLQRRLNRPGQTTRTVGDAIGKSHAYVQQRVDLLRLISEFRDLLRGGEINIKTARWLGTKSEEEQLTLLAVGPPYGRGARLGNPVSTGAGSGGGSRSAAPSAAPGMNGARPDGHLVAEDGAEEVAVGGGADVPAGNPVSTADRKSPTQDPAAGESSSGVMSRSPRTTPVVADSSHETGVGNIGRAAAAHGGLETTRVRVAQWLDSALGELDRALPSGGDGHAGSILAEVQRLLSEARSKLR